MAYAIIRTKKLKTTGEIAGSAAHTYRERHTANANSRLTHKNVSTGATSKDDLLEKVNRRLDTVKTVRSNAVICVEYLITASPEAFTSGRLDYKDYFKKSLDFLREKHGRENVIAATVHLDETTPHLVAYVVPIDQKGKLNCRSFLGGREKMSELQSAFAESVGTKFGLERGVEGSIAEHRSIKEFYEKVNAPTPELKTRVPRPRAPSITDTMLEKIGIETDYSRAVDDAKAKRLIHDKEAKARFESMHAKAQMYDLTAASTDSLKKDLASARETSKRLSQQMRSIELERVLQHFQSVRNEKDKKNWDTEKGRISIDGQKFFNHDAGAGGGGAIDLVMHLHDCDFKTALVTLSEAFGSDLAASELASASMQYVKDAEVSTKPVRSVVPEDRPETWPRVRAWLSSVRKIPTDVIDRFRAQGLIRSDERNNALFMNERLDGCEIRGVGQSFKGYRGKRGLMIYTRSDEKSVLVVESGTDALAYASQSKLYGKIASTGGDFGQQTIDDLKKLKDDGYRICIGTDNDESGDKKAKILIQSLGLSHAERDRPRGRDWQKDMKERQNQSPSEREAEKMESTKRTSPRP